jgi:hypothetical protein
MADCPVSGDQQGQKATKSPENKGKTGLTTIPLGGI